MVTLPDLGSHAPSAALESASADGTQPIRAATASRTTRGSTAMMRELQALRVDVGSLKRRLEELEAERSNEIARLRVEIEDGMDMINRSIKRIARPPVTRPQSGTTMASTAARPTQPVIRPQPKTTVAPTTAKPVQPAVRPQSGTTMTTTTARPIQPAVLPQSRTTVATTTSKPILKLPKCPRDLYILWQEYEVGRDGVKPAKLLTSAERGANKSAYSRRKVFWDAIDSMVGRGHTSDSAIDKVYHVYGRDLCVTDILKKMRVDRQNGGHPELF